MKNFDENRKLILKKLKIGENDFLGKGVESFVYAYGKNQVIRILKEGNLKYLKSLKKLQELIIAGNLSVKTPLITDMDELDRTVYTIETKMDGENLSKIFDTYNDLQKEAVVKEYFVLLTELAKVDVGGYEFGQIADTKDKITDTRWSGFLIKKIRQKTDLVKKQLNKDVINFDEKLNTFLKLLKIKITNVEKHLVHGDYFYDNVMANHDAKVTGILDFSGWTTVVGDFRLDVCGAIIFLEHSEKFIKYQKLLTELAKQRYGTNIEWFIDFYRIYYCLFLSDSFLYLKPLYDWCVKNLNDNNLWKRLLL